MSHSPGPFVITTNCSPWLTIRDAKGREVARAVCGHRDSGADPVPSAELWANARLFKAAPDLLDAAKAALAKLEAICRFCDERLDKHTDIPCGRERCHTKRLIGQLQAAIEKAEGGEKGAVSP